jgi:uncharacterized protein (TIGR02266 family)
VSDREIARRWGMEWRSFLALKQGQRQVPRIDQLERLASVLNVDATLVYQAASEQLVEPGHRQEVLQTFFDHTPAACILFEADGTISAANPLVEKVCPVSRDEMIGRNAVEVFGHPGPAGCPVMRAFLTGRVEQQVSCGSNKRGERVYVHRTAQPILDGTQVVRVLELMVDVTDQVSRGDLRVLSLWRGQPESFDPPQPGKERRAWPRAPVSFVAKLRFGRSTCEVRVHNLGAGGMFIETRVAVPIGRRIELAWTLPGDRVPVRAQGVVVWAREQEGSSGLGICFTELKPKRAKAS